MQQWKFRPSNRHIKISAVVIRCGLRQNMRALLGWIVRIPETTDRDEQRLNFDSWEDAIYFVSDYLWPK